MDISLTVKDMATLGQTAFNALVTRAALPSVVVVHGEDSGACGVMPVWCAHSQVSIKNEERTREINCGQSYS